MSDDEQNQNDELEEQEAAVLPAREAMSLITADTSTPSEERDDDSSNQDSASSTS